MRPFEFISGRGSATVILVALAATCMLSGCAAAALIPEAARQVRQFIESTRLDVPSDQRLFAEADAALAAGDLATAEAYCEAILSNKPYHKQALATLADIYRLTGHPELAF